MRQWAAAGSALLLATAGGAAVQVVSAEPAAAASAHALTISGGFTHSCMIRGGKGYCWGDNASGELGNGTTVSSSTPVPVYTGGVLAGVTLTQIMAGVVFSCALSSAGAVYCWGANNKGQLGNNGTANSSGRVRAPGGQYLQRERGHRPGHDHPGQPRRQPGGLVGQPAGEHLVRQLHLDGHAGNHLRAVT